MRSAPAPVVRLAELLAALSTAADLAMGQPREHSLRSALLAARLAEETGADRETRDTAYLVTLLRWSGCTANASAFARLLGDDIGARAELVLTDPTRPAEIAALWARRAVPGSGSPSELFPALAAEHCEVAKQLATGLGLPERVVRAVGEVFERWDGHGIPAGRSGDELERAGTLAVTASDTEILARATDLPFAVEAVQRRAGAVYDPRLAAALPAAVHRWEQDLASGPVWTVALAAAPRAARSLGREELDGALVAIAGFVDLKVPALSGHSGAVAGLAEGAARQLRLAAEECEELRRAGLVHDLGRVAISNAVWEAPRSLTAAEWDAVRLHPYYSERCLSRVPALAALARTGSLHHERVDGSGYYRELPGAAQPLGARVLAVADTLAALRAGRPQRPALPAQAAVGRVLAEVRGGRLDGVAAEAVLAGVGQRRGPARSSWPAGLSDREVDVLRLVARGATNRQAASRLRLSPKTVGRHVENVYGKLGVHSRAAATFAALRLGLLDPTEETDPAP